MGPKHLIQSQSRRQGLKNRKVGVGRQLHMNDRCSSFPWIFVDVEGLEHISECHHTGTAMYEYTIYQKMWHARDT